AHFTRSLHDALPIWQHVPHENVRDPQRALRIGYVSPNFYRHAVAAFVRPIIASHAPGRFIVTCYSDTRVADDYTKEFRAAADHRSEEHSSELQSPDH